MSTWIHEEKVRQLTEVVVRFEHIHVLHEFHNLLLAMKDTGVA